MAQPVFLRNFTLNGVDIGELFVVGTVTIPFLNVERGYYQVGNSDGQNLQYTRIGNNTLTFDGHLITEHSGLSISETKDLLVAQVMSREPMRLVFDALPDRYFNVVFEGTQEYDATNLDITPLTLTFSCPEGVAHSILSDPFRNTQSTSTNMLVDSEFQTKTYWSDTATVLETQRNGSNVLSLDFSDEQIEDMGLVVHDFVSDDVFYETDDLIQGSQVTFATNYGIPKVSEFDEDGSSTFEVVIDEMDKINGKVLHTHTTPLPTNGEVRTAYAFNETGTDRFSFNDEPNPNIFPQGTSEEPTPIGYSGTTWVTTDNQVVPEWGATNARRMVSSGGNQMIKGFIHSNVTALSGANYVHSLYVKNNGSLPVEIRNNMGGSYDLNGGESKRIVFDPCAWIPTPSAPNPPALQFTIRATAGVNQALDLTVWRAKVELSNDSATQWTDGNTPTVDNTSPTYVGYSTTDTVPEDTAPNLLLNGAQDNSTQYWGMNKEITATPKAGYMELTKSTTSSTRAGYSSIPYTAYRNTTYTVSGSVQVKSGYSGQLGATQLITRLRYSDGTHTDIGAIITTDAVDNFVRYTATGTTENKPTISVEVMVLIDGSFVGTIYVSNLKLEQNDHATPFTPHITERGKLYTWYPIGTGLDASTIPMTRTTQTYTIQNEATKVLRLSLNVYGNAHVVINRPMLTRGTDGTYVASVKEFLKTVPVTNYGTWKSYPIFEITNAEENGMIAVMNENGKVLQFGNEENKDATEPIKDEIGLNESYRGTKLPTGFTVNSGHVSQYPNTANDPARPNLYMGSWDYSPSEAFKPKWATTFAPNAWSGPSLTSPVKAPSTGLRTGAFKFEERIDFGTTSEKNGRYELVILTDANDILMSMTIRDSDAKGNEVIVEYWYGNKLLKSIKTDVTKYKSSWFRCTMTRDQTGKKFTWNFEHIQSNNGIKPVTKNPFTYNAPVANKASVVKTSRWLLKYKESKATREVVHKVTWTMKSKEVLHIRAGSKTSYKSYGLLPKGVTFETTKRQTGQKIINNNQWYYVTKNSGKKIPASGWVSGYYLQNTKRVEHKKKETYSIVAKMQVTDSRFTWMGTGKSKESKNPFKAGDKIVINTHDKTFFVNGVEREDLATIGNQWEGFALDVGEHFLQFINSDWATDTLEVTVKNQRTYL